MFQSVKFLTKIELDAKRERFSKSLGMQDIMI